MALTHTPDRPELGLPLPEFDLPATDGRRYQHKDFDRLDALVVMFICNHCPYVQAVEDRLIALGRYFAGKPVQFIAVSSNDATRYPDDSFAKMRERALAKQYPFPYLFDETQEVARRFGAVCTPDFFLYDRRMTLAYRGRLDDSWKDASAVQKEDLKQAILDLLDGGRPEAIQKPSMGCSIKWKS
jgi:peroxiredoxin